MSNKWMKWEKISDRQLLTRVALYSESNLYQVYLKINWSSLFILQEED